ncbi:hypothetical protein P7D68_17750 [Enterococcus avium]|uniref:hypothetical protein n=1 Tax=Enterococcus avium TaxID=33945 RepID=UPI002890FF3F|nr:hypothetical protein [Enterococcus avium]MDT2472049.1 hypothetical protein [Enterococcus avium]
MTYYALKSHVGAYIKSIKVTGHLHLTENLTIDIVSERRELLNKLAQVWNESARYPIEVVEVDLEEVAE